VRPSIVPKESRGLEAKRSRGQPPPERAVCANCQDASLTLEVARPSPARERGMTPYSSRHFLSLGIQPGQVEGGMFDRFPLPGVNEVNLSVTCLNQEWVGEFLTRF